MPPATRGLAASTARRYVSDSAVVTSRSPSGKPSTSVAVGTSGRSTGAVCTGSQLDGAAWTGAAGSSSASSTEAAAASGISGRRVISTTPARTVRAGGRIRKGQNE